MKERFENNMYFLFCIIAYACAQDYRDYHELYLKHHEFSIKLYNCNEKFLLPVIGAVQAWYLGNLFFKYHCVCDIEVEDRKQWERYMHNINKDIDRLQKGLDWLSKSCMGWGAVSICLAPLFLKSGYYPLAILFTSDMFIRLKARKLFIQTLQKLDDVSKSSPKLKNIAALNVDVSDDA
jgi:hypothetical protein